MSRPILSLKKPISGWTKSSGTIVYDPKRLTEEEFKKTHKTRTMIVELGRTDLDSYYRSILVSRFGPWMNLARPMFGLHLTVVKGNEPVKNMDAWKKHAGKRVEFEYDPTTLRRTSGFTMRVKGNPNPVPFGFWVIDVRSDALIEMRRELGCRESFIPHLTIAREMSEIRVTPPAAGKLSSIVDRMLELIPERNGNQALEADLRSFRANLKVGLASMDGSELIRRVYANLPHPAAPWENEIVKLLA